MSALLAFLAPTLLGLAVVAALDPAADGTRAGRLLRAVTGVALGAALVSASHAAILLFAGSSASARSTAKDLGFSAVAALAGAALWRGRRRAPGGSPPLAPPSPRVPAAALGAVALACLATAAILVVRTRAMPDGEWDAYAFWNLRARLLLRGGGDAGVVFSGETFHPDYPLLVPGLTATGWLYTGDGPRWVPAVGAFLWMSLLVVGMGAAAARLAGARAACLGVLLLLGAPNLAKVASWQYADVPTAALLLLAVTWYALALREPRAGARARLALCGLCVSLASWTKNEGLAQALVLAIAVATIPPAGLPRGKALLAFAAGAAPFLALSIAFKASIGPGNDLLAQAAPGSLLSRVTDPGRYLQIARSFGEEAFRTSAWNLLIPLALLAPALWTPAGLPRERRAIGTVLVLLGLAYAGVYVLTPKPLVWHLSSSLHRLLIHVYPLLVLAAVVWRGRLRWVPRPRGA